MEPAEVGGKGWEEMVAGRHGIREPGANAGRVELGEIDLVLVPGVAFDGGCHRLGRGGGFYDRFLAQAGLGRAWMLGVGFGVQLVERVPRSSHDRQVDGVVTDRAIVMRRRQDAGRAG